MKIEGINQNPMGLFPAQASAPPQVMQQAPGPQDRIRSVSDLPQNGRDPITSDEISERLESLNVKLIALQRSIQFTVDEESKDIVINVVDTSNGEVIRQIPPEEILRLRHALEEIAGLMLEEIA